MAEKKPLWKNPFVVAFVGGVVAITVLPFLQRMSLRAPPPIASIGSYTLVDERGAPFGSAQLKGNVYIASFFFTRCPSVCPAQQESMKKILRHIDDVKGITLVSFTVDPEHDTPEVLAAYANKMGAPAGAWKFLTGSESAMRELLVKQFLVAMGERKALDGSADLYDIAHSAKFALVDQNGELRGFWSTDDLGRGNIINAARMLAKYGPNP
jgi:protein SCO1/2